MWLYSRWARRDDRLRKRLCSPQRGQRYGRSKEAMPCSNCQRRWGGALTRHGGGAGMRARRSNTRQILSWRKQAGSGKREPVCSGGVLLSHTTTHSGNIQPVGSHHCSGPSCLRSWKHSKKMQMTGGASQCELKCCLYISLIHAIGRHGHYLIGAEKCK